MPAPAVVIVPTAGRPGYLDVTLASVTEQVTALGAELLVVDDGPSEATRATAERHGARYVGHERQRGLNAARNTAIDVTDAPLLCFLDDDVRVHPGWLAALLEAAAELDENVCVLTGPILARIEDHAFRSCGREQPPITHLDLGPHDAPARYAWGANMTIRRSAIDRAGRFDPTVPIGGDEQEWQDRVVAAGGSIRYIAAAGVDHRRAGDDARLRALCRAAYRRGQAARRFDQRAGVAPSTRHELRVLAGCITHGPRRRCAAGPVMTAHALGRLTAAWADRGGLPPATAGIDDFLSGSSGLALGRRGALLGLHDLALDMLARAGRTFRRAARGPAREVLVLAVERDDVPSILAPALAELRRGHHRVTVAQTTTGDHGRGKFEHLNALLAGQDLSCFDWVIVIDDDITLPRGFLDTFLAAAEAGGLELAQPAHRRRSHAAWPVTRRARGSDWRETTFVEIGPLTAFSRTAAAALLPFPPELKMGWGLDVHWSALAADRGWRIGVIDATPIAHLIRPTADGYRRQTAADEARQFLAGRRYTPRGAVRTLSTHRFGENGH